MSKKTTQVIFLASLVLCLILVVLIHVLAVDFLLGNESYLFISETILYLTGLGTLFMGWRIVDHKIPSKNRDDEH